MLHKTEWKTAEKSYDTAFRINLLQWSKYLTIPITCRLYQESEETPTSTEDYKSDNNLPFQKSTVQVQY